MSCAELTQQSFHKLKIISWGKDIVQYYLRAYITYSNVILSIWVR